MKRGVTILLTFLLAATMISHFYVAPAKAVGTVYVHSDGSIDPPGTPIITSDKVTYTLTGNINNAIVVERSNIVIDGKAHTVKGDGTSWAFKLSGINNVTIRNTNIENFTWGIYIESASFITAEENNITLNSYDGIGQFFSSHVTIAENNISSNGYDGIEMYRSTDNTISRNEITANKWYGIATYYSSNNSIIANKLTDNLNGIELSASQTASIFHNDFINHTHQLSILSSGAVWDDGYPSGGNYWADNPNRTDSYRGPNQDQPGSDGIADTPYTIDVNNADHYPLTKPYGGLHDIGLIKGLMTKTAISQGKDLNVTIIIINYGFTTETSNITAYFDTTQLVQTQITLTSRNSTAQKFVLNTTDLTRGNHTITAYADPVLDETTTTDNTLHSWVTITFTGDVNGDGRVDMKDVSFVAKRFGSDPSKPNWDTSADVNDDGRVDMKDISAVAKNFGKSGP